MLILLDVVSTCIGGVLVSEEVTIAVLVPLEDESGPMDRETFENILREEGVRDPDAIAYLWDVKPMDLDEGELREAAKLITAVMGL